MKVVSVSDCTHTHTHTHLASIQALYVLLQAAQLRREGISLCVCVCVCLCVCVCVCVCVHVHASVRDHPSFRRTLCTEVPMLPGV